MAKHRVVSTSRGRTVVGGVLAGAAFAFVAPAGLALATPADHDVATPGDSVGRPTLGNPAPGVRLAQNFGDSVFNDGSAINSTLNASPLGVAYHDAFGYAGTITTTAAGVNRYDPDAGAATSPCGAGKNGCNGYIKGALNAPPGQVIGDAIPIKECNLLRDNQSGVPKGLRKC